MIKPDFRIKRNLKAMKIVFFYYCLILCSITAMSQEKKDYIKISQELLYAVKTDKPADSLLQCMAEVLPGDLLGQLKSDSEKKAFWLNIYNAYTQIGLKQNPEAYHKRNLFFSHRFIDIAGKKLSLDLIEHGILRRSKWKYSLGYANKLFLSTFEKKFRVNKLDYRIHFALNCGAKSCPPIAFYQSEQIDRQLDIAEKTYLKSETLFNGKNLTVDVPAILSWFRADFGGKKGIIGLLQKLNIVPENVKPEINWKKYDWSLLPKAFE